MMKENIKSIINEEWFILVDPEGVMQPTTLADNKPIFWGFLKMMESYGAGQPLKDLIDQGFRMQKVKLTIEPIYENTTPDNKKEVV